jgi:hypothetical protein
MCDWVPRVEFTMKIWIISVLLGIFLSNPAVSHAALDPLDSGAARVFNCWLLKIPTGSSRDSDAAREEQKEGQASTDETKEKEKHDKKVDDAIRKAWEK